MNQSQGARRPAVSTGRETRETGTGETGTEKRQKRGRIYFLVLDSGGGYREPVEVSGQSFSPRFYPCADSGCIASGVNVDLQDDETKRWLSAVNAKALEEAINLGSFAPIGGPIGKILGSVLDKFFGKAGAELVFGGGATNVVKNGVPGANESIGKLIDTLELRKRTLELSLDPDRGQYLIREGIGAARFEQATGRTVTRSADGATDFIDSKLGAFDLKGPLRANDGSAIEITPGRLEGLGNSIIKEANNSTASKAVVVDTLGMTKEQVIKLKEQVANGLKGTKPIVYVE